MTKKPLTRYGLFSRVIPEASYPGTYRQADTQALCELIKKQESVCVMGMKRVGISNFLRFLAFNPAVKAKYLGQEKILFIATDANDLIEISPRAFWLMLLVRFHEAVQRSVRDPLIKKEVTKLLIRFDRLQKLLDLQFFANLQALRDVAKHQVSYILTSRRRLAELCPDCFIGASLNLFARSYFLKPASLENMEAIRYYFERRVAQNIDLSVKEKIFELCAGHIQFTQLALIAWSEWAEEKQADVPRLLKHLLQDERILLQCEEIWEHLLPIEKEFLRKIAAGKKPPRYEERGVAFLFESGLVLQEQGRLRLFSPLLTGFVQRELSPIEGKRDQEFSRKEYHLFSCLKEKSGQLCSREEVIEAVWPDYAELGISDWTIDRLVSRLRKKMILREEPYSLRTIRGRGFTLVEK